MLQFLSHLMLPLLLLLIENFDGVVTGLEISRQPRNGGIASGDSASEVSDPCYMVHFEVLHSTLSSLGISFATFDLLLNVLQ
jgi:hypothetical protein